jgi:hypothetical protein
LTYFDLKLTSPLEKWMTFDLTLTWRMKLWITFDLPLTYDFVMDVDLLDL